MIYIPLNLDRLRAGITVLCDLLRFVARNSLFHRPSLTNPEALHPHGRCRFRSVNCLNCASRFLAAMPLSKSMDYYLISDTF